MNREIKFRAWDKQGNIHSNENGGMISMDDWESRYDYKMPMPYKNGRYDFMQFTGLKDKNGKEIYHEDILLADDRRKVRVIWRDDIGQWDTRFISDTLPNNSFNELRNEHWAQRAEIVGNIYESPNLLK